MPNSVRSLFKNPFVALTSGLIFGVVLSSLSITADAEDFGDSTPASEASPIPQVMARFGSHNDTVSASDAEVSPDDFAREYGLPQTDDQPFDDSSGFSKSIPQTRVVAPENFGDFRVNLDIFRRSLRNPVLGQFQDEYISVLVPNGAGMTPDQQTATAKKLFAKLAGKEFGIASLDGVPYKAFIVSGAIEQKVSVPVKDAEGNTVIDPATGSPETRLSLKTTPPGNFRLDALTYDKALKAPDGTSVTTSVAFPWIKSTSYNNSQMYWGVWIHGGYFIHSTPHYGELGMPASMGCIRQSFEDAQALFKLIVDDGMSGMIRIHAIGSDDAVSRFLEITVAPKDPSKDAKWVLTQLATEDQRIRDSIAFHGTDELNILGDEWVDPTAKRSPGITWPACGTLQNSPIDCFTTWGVRKPKNSLN
jgi:hypothetical protein